MDTQNIDFEWILIIFKFLFIVKGKSHRLNTRFRAGSVVDLSHMNEGYAPQNPEFWGFSKFERLFFWVNLIEFDSICIDLHRSALICLDLNLKISSIFRIYQDFDSLFTFHMGEVNNWPPRRQSESVGLGNFLKFFKIFLKILKIFLTCVASSHRLLASFSSLEVVCYLIHTPCKK